MRQAHLLPLLTALVLSVAGSPAVTRTALGAPTTVDQPSSKAALAAAQARLAFHLVKTLASAKGAPRTITVSPASLVAALGPVALGSDDGSKKQLIAALGFSDSKGTPDKTSLDLLAEAREALRGAAGEALRSADRLVFAPAFAPGPSAKRFLNGLEVPYAIEDLSKPEAVAEINGWVKEKTSGLIPEILSGPVDKAALVALNALHFKARWKTVFDPQQTAPAPFAGLDKPGGSVAMMHLPPGERAYRKQGRFVAVDLPFADELFSLVVVTTTDKPAKVEAFAEAASWLTGLDFQWRRGDLALPRFTASGSADLLPALGLKDVRFGALALVAPGAVMTQALQRAVIEVTEEGAEAAAATAVVTTRSIEPQDVLQMVVDKPFLYALRHRGSGLVLIAGYVGETPKDRT